MPLLTTNDPSVYIHRSRDSQCISKSGTTPQNCPSREYDTIRYGRLTCAQKLTRRPTWSYPYPLSFISSSRTASTDFCLHRFSWATWFLISIFSLFFVYGPCARLSWPSRQLLSARKSTVSYRIVSSARYRGKIFLKQKQSSSEETVQAIVLGDTLMMTHWIIHYPSNTWFLGPSQLSPLNGISIGSAVFSGHIRVTNTQRQTDRQTTLHATSVTIGRIY